ncbi:unnamed protein product [Camellia sinensis]
MEQLSSATTAVESIVQQDGKVVTSRGPGTAMEFSVALVEQLFGKDKANEVSGPLVMRPNHGDEYTVLELNPMEWTFDNCPKILVPVADGTEEMEAEREAHRNRVCSTEFDFAGEFRSQWKTKHRWMKKPWSKYRERDGETMPEGGASTVAEIEEARVCVEVRRAAKARLPPAGEAE